MKKILIALLLFIANYAVYAQTTYNPAFSTVSNKPYGMAQFGPTDARAYFYDAINFRYRAYVDTAEILSYLNLSKYRSGQVLYVVNTGGTVSGGVITGGTNAFWLFKDGQADVNLVPFTSGTVGSGVTNVTSTPAAGITLTITTSTTTPHIVPSVSLGGDISGSSLSAVTVNKFNGLPPAYYLNYNNLTNTPTIPSQLNPTCSGCSITGTYPNLLWTITGSGGFTTAGDYLVSSGGGSIINYDTAHYPIISNIQMLNDSIQLITYNNRPPDSLLIPRGTGGGGGGVSTFSFTNANGVTGVVTNPGTTPNLTISLGAITPTTVNGLTLATISNGFTITGGTGTPRTLTVNAGNANVSGTNTGDVTISGAGRAYIQIAGQVITAFSVDLGTADVIGIMDISHMPALTGDVTNSAGNSLMTITNSAVTYPKIQNESTQTLLGRFTAGTGIVQEVIIGSGLSLNSSTGVLTSSATGGTVTNFTAGNMVPFFTTNVATSSSTPNLTFSITTVAGNRIWGNPTGSTATPIYFGTDATLHFISSLLGADTSIIATKWFVQHQPDTIRVRQAGIGIQIGYTSIAGDTLWLEAGKTSTTNSIIKNSDSSWSVNSLFTFTNSVSLSGGIAIALQNDNISPGNFKYYGTSVSGVKGWFDYTNIPVATLTTAGLLSAAEKARLDSTTYISNDRIGAATDSLAWFDPATNTVWIKGFAIRGGSVVKQSSQDSLVYVIGGGGIGVAGKGAYWGTATTLSPAKWTMDTINSFLTLDNAYSLKGTFSALNTTMTLNPVGELKWLLNTNEFGRIGFSAIASGGLEKGTIYFQSQGTTTNHSSTLQLSPDSLVLTVQKPTPNGAANPYIFMDSAHLAFRLLDHKSSPAGTDSVLITDIDNNVYKVPSSSFGGGGGGGSNNVYNIDSTLATNRTITTGGRWLKLTTATEDESGTPTPQNFWSQVSSSATASDIVNTIIRTNGTAANSATLQGIESYTKTSNSSGTYAHVLSLIGNYEKAGAGTVTASEGVTSGGVALAGAGGTLTNWYNFKSNGWQNISSATTTVTNVYGFYATANVVGSGTLTNDYPFYAASTTGVNVFAGKGLFGSVTDQSQAKVEITNSSGNILSLLNSTGNYFNYAVDVNGRLTMTSSNASPTYFFSNGTYKFFTQYTTAGGVPNYSIGFTNSGTGLNTSAILIDSLNNVNTYADLNGNGSSTIHGYNAVYNNQSGTSYSLQSSDNGKIITLNNASAITLTVPSGLPIGFNCTIVQLGAGQATFTASSTTIHNRQSFTKTAGQYAVATVVSYTTNVFVTGGDMQ